MILKGNEDLRIKKTITNIHKAFMDLITKKDYSKITVKEICDIAVINKKTFYNYYQSLDDLLFEMQTIMLEEFSKKTKNFKMPEDLYKVNEEFYKFSVSKGEVYEKIMTSNLYSDISKRITTDFVKSVWSEFDSKNNLGKNELNIFYCFLQNSGLELYKQWVLDGKKLPLDEIISLSGKLLCSGVNGFLNI